MVNKNVGGVGVGVNDGDDNDVNDDSKNADTNGDNCAFDVVNIDGDNIKESICNLFISTIIFISNKLLNDILVTNNSPHALFS